MSPSDFALAADPAWVQHCVAGGVDPLQRLQVRLAILGHVQAQDCTLYRPDQGDLEAEESELGDACVLFSGPFQPPAEWAAAQRAEYFADDDPALFFEACIECEAAVGSAAFFLAEIGDHVASISAAGQVVMYFVHDCFEAATGRHCVLVREDELLV